MRIGIDARFYGSAGKGLGRYTSELIAHLEQLDHENDYVILLRRANWDDYAPRNPRFTKALADVPWYGVREQLLLPFILLRQRLDLVHFPHFNVPLLYPKRFVVTVHDLILLHFPTTRATTLGPIAFKIKFLLYRLVMRLALRRAAAVFAVSEFTKQDLLAAFPFLSAKPPVVTYPACGSRFRRASDAPTAPRARSRTMLYVGNAYPHKNLERLIDAFHRFRGEHAPDMRLAIVGGGDYFHDRLAKTARATGMDDGVDFIGSVSDDELLRRYDDALFYVFPSRYEGFGIPPLEAMCRDVPVAASDATCLPETLGDAAEYFDPTDTDDIVRAMRRLTDDAARRDELRANGRVQAARFDWNETAATTLREYRRALGLPTP